MRNKKLIGYSMAAGVFLSLQAEAQIAWYDLEDVKILDLDPDNEVETELAIDFDDDGKTDFYVYHYFSSSDEDGSHANVVDMTFAGAAFLKSDDGEYARVLNSGDPIDLEGVWAEEYASLGSFSATVSRRYLYGFWENQKQRFLGIILIKENEPYFGWMRISVEQDFKGITLHDMAVQKTAYKAISAGQKTKSGNSVSKGPLLILSENQGVLEVVVPAAKDIPKEITISDEKGKDYTVAYQQKGYPIPNKITFGYVTITAEINGKPYQTRMLITKFTTD